MKKINKKIKQNKTKMKIKIKINKKIKQKKTKMKIKIKIKQVLIIMLKVIFDNFR